MVGHHIIEQRRQLAQAVARGADSLLADAQYELHPWAYAVVRAAYIAFCKSTYAAMWIASRARERSR